MLRITALSAVLALATLQPGYKTLIILDAWNEEKTSPIKISSVDLYGQEIISDQPFQASDDWLRDLKFMVQNVSDKPINQIMLRLEIPINGQNFVYPIS